MNNDSLKPPTVSVDEVIRAYAEATPNGNDLEILADFSRRHPEYERELTDFAAGRDLFDFDEAEPTIAETALFARIGRDVYREMSARKSDEPISSLTELAERRGLRRPELAARLGITVSLVQYVEKRRLDFATIPAKFIENFANVVGASAEAVGEYLRRGPELRPAASYKSATRPSDAGQRSFADAVNEDPGLSPERRRELLNL